MTTDTHQLAISKFASYFDSCLPHGEGKHLLRCGSVPSFYHPQWVPLLLHTKPFCFILTAGISNHESGESSNGCSLSLLRLIRLLILPDLLVPRFLQWLIRFTSSQIKQLQIIINTVKGSRSQDPIQSLLTWVQTVLHTPFYRAPYIWAYVCLPANWTRTCTLTSASPQSTFNQDFLLLWFSPIGEVCFFSKSMVPSPGDALMEFSTSTARNPTFIKPLGPSDTAFYWVGPSMAASLSSTAWGIYNDLDNDVSWAGI